MGMLDTYGYMFSEYFIFYEINDNINIANNKFFDFGNPHIRGVFCL